jgi:hypothetical protein
MSFGAAMVEYLKTGQRSASPRRLAVYLQLTALLVVAAMSQTEAIASAPGHVAISDSPAKTDELRRLTQTQYRQIIADVFGPDIVVANRFEPEERDSGLIEVGTSQLGVTATGVEGYSQMAQAIAAQITDEHHRHLMPCAPVDRSRADDQCARQYFAATGRLLLRRRLTAAELQMQVDMAHAAAVRLKDFYEGVAFALSGLLVSPQFLFRHEVSEVDALAPGRSRLDGVSKASRLSFFLWNAGPDSILLKDAEDGRLDTQAGVNQEVARMIASIRFQSGVRAFFTDMLHFSDFGELAKDNILYPAFSAKLALQMQEQTLRTIVDQLVVNDGDYRDILTSNKTFLSPLLAALYRVPLPPVNDSGADVWQPYEFPAASSQAGLLAEASFTALHSHPGRSSPTLRGKAVREVFLCQKVPNPPGNVDFKFVQDTKNPNYKTARSRLAAHATEPACAGCHKLTDPIGLAFETFDTIGSRRAQENGAAIDTSGTFNNVPFADAVSLGRIIRDNPALPRCLTARVFSYGVGRKATAAETSWIDSNLEKEFEQAGFRLGALFARIATSDTFYTSAAPDREARSTAGSPQYADISENRR